MADVSSSSAGGESDQKPAPPPNASFAAVPFSAMLIATPVGMYLDGSRKLPAAKLATASVLDILGAANSTAALTWATLLGNLLAVGLPLVTGFVERRACGRPRTPSSASLHGLVGSWVEGIQEVSEALTILLLAWALGSVTSDVHAAPFLASALGSWLPPTMLPFVTMVLAMATSFGIGSAWGTMGVLVPLVAPLAWELGGRDVSVLTACLGATLGGSVFGNVASPLADTSVLSSMVCRCDMLSHVGSQATYVALTASLSLLVGALPVGLGILPIGAALALASAILAASPLIAHCRPRRLRALVVDRLALG